jgi:hypothetical protein
MIHNIISAGISALCEIIVVHPIDVYKVLYQQNPNYNIYTYANTPLRFKYRGVIARTIGIIPMRTTFWVSQDFAKLYFPTYKIEYINYSMIGSFTAFCQTIVDTPIENIKMNRINYIPSTYTYSTLYRGFSPNYFRNSIFATHVISCNEIGNKYNVNSFITGSIGGLIGSIMSQPIDYIKTMQQSDQSIYYKDIIMNPYHRYNCMNGWFPRASVGFISMGIGNFVFCYCKKFI